MGKESTSQSNLRLAALSMTPKTLSSELAKAHELVKSRRQIALLRASKGSR